MQRGSGQIEPHRFKTKGKQWVWIQCSAKIQTSPEVLRIHCVYSLVKKPILLWQPKVKNLTPVVASQSTPFVQTSIRDDVILRKSFSRVKYIVC